MSQYLDKDGASRIVENFLSKQAEQDAILKNLQFDLKEAEHALVKTIQGPAPLNIRALTRPLDDYLISGNTVQDGTPTPEVPVDVVGCGVRTENLFDKNNITDAGQFYINTASSGDGSAFLIDSMNTCMFMLPCKPSTTYTVKRDATTTKRFTIGFVDDGNLYSRMPVTAFAYNATAAVLTATSTSGSQYLLVCYAKKGGSGASTAEEIQSCLDTLMVVEGSTAPVSYIPYGYKLPPTVNGTEYPIYLGQVPTTRRVKKLVLTGEEAEWEDATVGGNHFYLSPALYNGAYIYIGVLSTHYTPSNVAGAARPNNSIRQVTSGLAASRLSIRDDTCITIDDFKAFLAAQYAAGTPVTVWYVLATPETGIVNEPLHKIGDYADTISYAQSGVKISTTKGFNTITTDTTVLPSNIEVKGVINNA